MTESLKPTKLPLKKSTENRPHIPLFNVETIDKLNRNASRRPVPQMEELLKAYSAKDLNAVKHLLLSGLAVNYREPVFAHRTPLLYAAKFDFVEALDELLARGADITLADDAGITPLHAAVRNGSLNPLKRLLEVGADPNAKTKQGKTPLHVATRALGEEDEANACIIVQTLINGGAVLSFKDEEDRTPLHEAAFVGNAGVISLLLTDKGASLVFERDIEGRTPLHLAVLGARSLKAVKLLLQYNSFIDARDNDGLTALHFVAGRSINHADIDFDLDCLELLLTAGASVQIKDDSGKNALSHALQRTMWWNRQASRDAILHSVQLLVAKGSAIVDGFDMWRIVETFPSLVMVALNQSVRVNTSAKDSLHLKLILDFRPLTVSSRLMVERTRQTTSAFPTDEQPIPPFLLNDSEIGVLHYIHWIGHKNLLRHPLCSAFLHLKWLKVRKFFISHVLLYFLFVLAFTSYILCMQDKYTHGTNNNSTNVINSSDNNGLINNNCTSNFNNNDNCTHTPYFSTNTVYALWVILIYCTIFFIFKEILQIGYNPSIYIRHYENFIDILILLCAILVLSISDNSYLLEQRYLSTIAVISSWSRLMLFLGQFPSCGVYIVMFSTVCKTVILFLSMYMPLLIAFALGFFILLHELVSYNHLFTSFVSTLVMMTGEIEYEDRFLNNKNLLSTYVPCLILIVFLLLIYIILSNLLVALAVNDLNSIQQRSEILRLTRQVELMITVEKFLNSPFVPHCITSYFQKNFSLFHGYSVGMIALLPNKKYGFCEKLYLKLWFVFRCRRLLTKIFEHFVCNFIAPDVEPSLPKRLIQEATQLALTELEIEKRDKLLFSKSHQLGSMKQRLMLKRQRNVVKNKTQSVLSNLPRRDSLQKNFKNIPYYFDEIELDHLLSTSRQEIGSIHPTPSLRASLWRANINKETFLNADANKISDERQALNLEIEELRKVITCLIERLPSTNQDETKTGGFSPHLTRRSKVFKAPLIKSSTHPETLSKETRPFEDVAAIHPHETTQEGDLDSALRL